MNIQHILNQQFLKNKKERTRLIRELYYSFIFLRVAKKYTVSPFILDMMHYNHRSTTEFHFPLLQQVTVGYDT